MTRKPIVMIMVMMIAAMTGCSPDGEETPSPQPVASTPTPTPSPQWTPEEQGAIDAVQKYLEVWTNISQNLGTADWNQIRDVASDPAASDDVSIWTQWLGNGWHLVGAPGFIADSVALGGLDGQGQRYHVHGCYSIEGSYLVDSNGEQTGQRGADRSIALYQVIKPSDDHYYVFEDGGEDTPC